MATLSPRETSPGRLLKKTLLRIDGKHAASVERFAGGDPYAEVVNEPGGLLPYAKKHLGELHFADLDLLVSLDADPVLHQWIRDAWFGKPSRDRLLLESMDTLTATSRVLQIAHPRLRTVVLPGLDATSRERRYLTLGVAPRGVLRTTGGALLQPDREERDFRAQYFHIELAGLDCSGVLAVDPIEVKIELPPEDVPVPEVTSRGTRRTSTMIFPDLHLHIDAEKADSFREWFEDFVIAGNNDDDKERDGSITYMEPLGDSLALLRVYHAGIYRITDEPVAPGAAPRVRVDLYCERMEFARTDTATGTSDTNIPPVPKRR